jgi:hypothetical protein
MAKDKEFNLARIYSLPKVQISISQRNAEQKV